MPKIHDEEGHTDLLWLYVPAVLIGCAALFITYQFVDPAPPSRIAIASGGPDGAYYAYANRYRQILARDGVTLDVLETEGSLENIELLESVDAGVHVAFVQGGTGRYATSDSLESLASVYYEPLWIFCRPGLTLRESGDIIDKRVSIGPRGSGTHALVLELLRDTGIDENRLEVSDLDGAAAVEALREGSLDMMALVASPSSELVQALLRSEGVALQGVPRAEAYIRRHRYLSRLTLPEGTINLAENIPPVDVELLAATANLVVDEDLHPALVDLLLQAAEEVHGNGGLFEQPGAFPSPHFLVFPLSDEAERYFTSGMPFLRRNLPYWAATLIDRLIVMLLPLVAIIIPLMRIMPPLYKWRVRRRVYKWYKDLRLIEREIQAGMHDQNVEKCADALAAIDAEVRKVKVPWSYAEELYQLRLHIRYVRESLLRRGMAGDTAARDSGALRPGIAEDNALEDAT